MDTFRTLQLIENELSAIEQMIHEARCCVYTDRRMRQAPSGVTERDWSPIIRLDVISANIEPRVLSHEEIVYRAQEKVEFAKLKLNLISKLLSGT